MIPRFGHFCQTVVDALPIPDGLILEFTICHFNELYTSIIQVESPNPGQLNLTPLGAQVSS